ncbi:MAG: hypothetical protein AMK75_07860 [Planctomycetes bacterium SM23_65]|nr:MAG: hypothetical protein AMK75_07860 [Planctomycetes bacterium SM23_65]
MIPETYGFSDMVPRHVPSAVRLRLLFGGFASQFGWIFLGFGMIFVWVFQADSAVVSLVRFSGKLETARGVVARSEHSGLKINERDVLTIEYRFTTADGSEHQGASYAIGKHLEPGTTVTVEYPKGNPSVSRIQGMNTTLFGPWVLFVLVFPAVGAVFIFFGLRKGFKGLRLLTNGKTGTGKLLSKEPTNTRINNQTVYKFTFEFKTDDGGTYQAVARTHRLEKLSDEEEPLLYDPANPSYVVMMDSLPGSPRIDEMGQIRTGSPAATFLVMIVPLASIIGHGYYAATKYLS